MAEVDGLKIHKQPKQEPNTERAVSGSTESALNAVRRLSWRERHVVPSAKDIRRWELAYQGASRNNSIQEGLTDVNLIRTVKPFRNALTTVHPPILNVEENDLGKATFALCLLPIVYGGIHLAAWGFEFPSPVESVLWKISCLFIMSTVIPVILVGALIEYLRPNFIWVSAFVLYSGVYAVARIFLVLESFLSLRHVPIGVYAAVPWVQNIPHI